MQEKEGSLLIRCQGIVRDVLLAFFGNEGIFLLMAFFYTGVLSADIFGWYGEETSAIYNFIIVPWGAALCLLRLQRRSADRKKTHGDVVTLFILYAWLVAPFAFRFGMTFNNLSAWFGYATVFFGIYASVSEAGKERRQNMLALVSGLFAVFAVIWSGLLLYYAAKGSYFDAETGGNVFGVLDGFLYAGVHYNITGMIALCLCMMSLAACGCAKNPLLKAVCIIPAAMSAAVVVLTQSRTSRYALLLALAIGAFDLLSRALASKGKGAALVAALLSAAVVLVGGYEVSKFATEAAIRHYATVTAERAAAEPQEEAPVNIPEEEAKQPEEKQEDASADEQEPAEAANAEEQAVLPEDETGEQIILPEDEADAQIPAEPVMIEDVPAGDGLAVRPGVDSTFSDRTTIWKNVLKTWQEEPKMMIIGNGVGHTGSKIVAGTIHEQNGAVAVHNTYLQWAADFGLIGFALMVVFLVIALRQALRVFCVKERARGAVAMCMMTAAALAVGMMESATLGAMTPINIVFMFALAQLAGMSREIASR